MAYTQFSNKFYVQTFDTSEAVPLGRYKVGQAMELAYVLVDIFKVGTMGGSETLTLKLYGSSTVAGTPIATSTAVTLSAVSYLSNANAIGWIRFTFDRENLNPNLWYYAVMSTANYTRNADTYYLGAVLDWPYAVNTLSGAPRPARCRFIGYRELTIG